MNAIKPIPFSTDMVRALLEGRKTVTRRVVKPQPKKEVDKIALERFHKPYSPGDILYVREAFWQSPNGEYTYKSDYNQAERLTWHSSIHMPREAARIFLRVTDVRVERLNDITEYGAQCEGVSLPIAAQKDPEYAEYIGGYYRAFSDLWDSTIKPTDRSLYGWEASPWVWVIGFERCGKPEEGTP